MPLLDLGRGHVGSLMGGAVALVVGALLAVGTAVGLVKAFEEHPTETDSSVVNYGSR
jgi:hypothetical protein